MEEFNENDLDYVVGGAHPKAAEQIHEENKDLFRRPELTREELDQIMANLPKDEFGNIIYPNEEDTFKRSGR